MAMSRCLYTETSFWFLSWQDNPKLKYIFNGEENHQQDPAINKIFKIPFCQTVITEKFNSKKLTESSSSASAAASASPGGSAGVSCRPEPESSTQAVGACTIHTETEQSAGKLKPWSSMARDVHRPLERPALI